MWQEAEECETARKEGRYKTHREARSTLEEAKRNRVAWVHMQLTNDPPELPVNPKQPMVLHEYACAHLHTNDGSALCR